MSVTVDVEDAAWAKVPGLERLAVHAAEAAFAAAGFDASATETAILFTDDETIAALNAEWRGKPTPTNVLSFPAPDDLPIPKGELRPLGDIVLASGVVAREAEAQGKLLPDHVTHLIIHGVLHLLGYDHEDEAEATEMERLEASILKGLGISNPYERQ
jgi:probable rRNA maturation factor